MKQKQTAEMWRDRIRRWNSSGLSAKEFAAQEGCKPKALMVWRWQLGLGPKRNKCRIECLAPQAEAPQFVQLLPALDAAASASPPSAKAAALPFELTLANGARLVIAAHFDRAALGALLELLGGR